MHTLPCRSVSKSRRPDCLRAVCGWDVLQRKWTERWDALCCGHVQCRHRCCLVHAVRTGSDAISIGIVVMRAVPCWIVLQRHGAVQTIWRLRRGVFFCRRSCFEFVYCLSCRSLLQCAWPHAPNALFPWALFHSRFIFIHLLCAWYCLDFIRQFCLPALSDGVLLS